MINFPMDLFSHSKCKMSVDGHAWEVRLNTTSLQLLIFSAELCEKTVNALIEVNASLD